MRKLNLFALLAIGVFLSVNAFAIDDPTYKAWTNKSAVSQQAGQATPVRVLKMVRNPQNLNSGVAFTSQITSGDAVVYSLVSDDGISVVYTTTSADAAFAGIAVTTIPSSDMTANSTAVEDVGRRNWGWILVHGPVIANVALGSNGTNSNSAGDPVITSTDAGRVTTFMSETPVMTGANVKRIAQGKGGFFYDTVGASDTNAEVQINLE